MPEKNLAAVAGLQRGLFGVFVERQVIADERMPGRVLGRLLPVGAECPGFMSFRGQWEYPALPCQRLQDRGKVRLNLDQAAAAGLCLSCGDFNKPPGQFDLGPVQPLDLGAA